MQADDIRSIGVVGGGVMGSGIALAFAGAGYPVVVVDISDEALRDCRRRIEAGRHGLSTVVRNGELARDEADAVAGRISYATDLAALAEADLVVEAVPEDEELKKQVFAAVEAMVKGEAVIATNTSGIALASLVQALDRADRFIGMHWFHPAVSRPLVELVYTPETSPEVLDATAVLLERIGKHPIRVKDMPGTYGFVANRIFYAAIHEAQAIVEAGIATADDVDTAMKLGYSWPAGPFEMLQRHRDGRE